jgi:hypothetical protein
MSTERENFINAINTAEQNKINAAFFDALEASQRDKFIKSLAKQDGVDGFFNKCNAELNASLDRAITSLELTDTKPSVSVDESSESISKCINDAVRAMPKVLETRLYYVYVSDDVEHFLMPTTHEKNVRGYIQRDTTYTLYDVEYKRHPELGFTWDIYFGIEEMTYQQMLDYMEKSEINFKHKFNLQHDHIPFIGRLAEMHICSAKDNKLRNLLESDKANKLHEMWNVERDAELGSDLKGITQEETDSFWNSPLMPSNFHVSKIRSVCTDVVTELSDAVCNSDALSMSVDSANGAHTLTALKDSISDKSVASFYLTGGVDGNLFIVGSGSSIVERMVELEIRFSKPITFTGNDTGLQEHPTDVQIVDTVFSDHSSVDYVKESFDVTDVTPHNSRTTVVDGGVIVDSNQCDFETYCSGIIDDLERLTIKNTDRTYTSVTSWCGMYTVCAFKDSVEATKIRGFCIYRNTNLEFEQLIDKGSRTDIIGRTIVMDIRFKKNKIFESGVTHKSPFDL